MRVAVFGAGYAGVTAARRLESRLPDDVELVVVDEDGRHLVQHEVHRVVRRPALADVIEFDAASLLETATVREARVTDLDPDAGVAELESTDGDETTATEFAFDYGVVTVGAETAFYDLPGVRETATPLKTVDDAETIRQDYLALDAGDRAVVGGAGLSGVQVAGELAALAEERDLDREVVVLEMADAVAPTFPERFQSAVREALADAGVDVRTGWRVERAATDRIETDQGDVDCDQFVWTGGIRGDDGLDGERPTVDRTLRLGERTFGAGDAVRVVDVDGDPAPAAAQTAIRQAPVAADNVAKLLAHDRGGAGFRPRLSSYRYDSLGWVVSVGDDAVAQVGPTVLRGRAATAAKTAVGAGYLSKVGAVRRAVGLVNEELGLGDAVADDARAD